MRTRDYLELKARLAEAGFAEEFDWAEDVGAPESAEAFVCEYVFVVCNSGMKATIARPIFERVWERLQAGGSASDVFGHAGKCAGIDEVWRDRDWWWSEFKRIEGHPQGMILEWFQNLPWIGPITKFHLARNLGLDFCKPDRHLVRIAESGGETPEVMCRRIANETGDRIGAVDAVIWRAAEQGWI